MSTKTRAAALIERAAQSVTSLTALTQVADAHYAATQQTVAIPAEGGYQIAPKYNPAQRISGFRRPKTGDLLGTIFGGKPLEFASVQDAKAAIEQHRLTFAGVLDEKAGPASFAQFVARHRGVLDDIADHEKAAANMVRQMLRSLGYREGDGWQHPDTGATVELKDVSWNGDSPSVWLTGTYAKGRIKRDFQMHGDSDVQDMYNLLVSAATA